MANAKHQRPDFPCDRFAGWECSTCGDLITRVQDGWVEWLACENDGVSYTLGVRLVHRTALRGTESCHYDKRREFQRESGIVEGLPLERFVGPDGLMLLLSLIASGDIPTDQIIELTKRVQIPGYELAREQLEMATNTGFLLPAIGQGFYLQSEISTLLQWRSRAA